MIYDDYRNLVKQLELDNIDEAKKMLRHMVVQNYRKLVESLSVDELLELVPEEDYELFDFNPKTGKDWEDE